MSLKLYDAHNHLQDDRFAGRQAELLAACRTVGVARMVVNGACESDWPRVQALAQRYPEVLPSFGYHPWYLAERTPHWQETLIKYLEQQPAAVGEVGLDRWKPNLPYADQEAVFIQQLRLAAERNLPVSIHCLQAWGRMLTILQSAPRPQVGFLLHSYGGPIEMVPAFVKLGGYFSLPGYFAQDRKTRHREVFRHLPIERLLVETDAPDQNLPAPRQKFSLTGPGADQTLNHPGNLAAVYEFAAEVREMPPTELATVVAENFHRLFGGMIPANR